MQDWTSNSDIICLLPIVLIHNGLNYLLLFLFIPLIKMLLWATKEFIPVTSTTIIAICMKQCSCSLRSLKKVSSLGGGNLPSGNQQEECVCVCVHVACFCNFYFYSPSVFLSHQIKANLEGAFLLCSMEQMRSLGSCNLDVCGQPSISRHKAAEKRPGELSKICFC